MIDDLYEVEPLDGEKVTPPKDQEAFVTAWLSEVERAFSREKDYRKEAKKIVDIYEMQESAKTPFNILFSNTETLAPALYNSTPRPVVQRRFKDDDPVGKVSSMVGQRTLEFLIDTDGREYTSFDDLMSLAVLSALIPGRGVVWFKYHADFEKRKDSEDKEYDAVAAEQVCGEVVPWDRFNHGYAKTWEDVPWISRTHFLTKDEVSENFGEEAAGIQFAAVQEVNDSQEVNVDSADPDAKGVNLACIHEIWDKVKREVYYISPGLKTKVIRKIPDPLGLTGFFPCAKPLYMFSRINSLTPVPLYKTYEEQAEELNKVTTRITKLITALKVRGFYDTTLEGMDKVMEAGDNELIPVQNAAALQQGQTLEKSLWLMPLDKIITALQQLYQQRQGVKQVIYEVTGIADIMRGSSMASETLGAQEIKNQWGTLRLKRMQRQVARFVRDSLRIMLEIASTKLSAETLEQLTGINLPDAQEKAAAMQQIQAAGMSGQQPPEDLIVAAKLPTWDEVLTLLRTDTLRQYRIDIETNSTVDAEATEDKQNVSEFLNAMAQFFNGVAPLVESQALPFDAARAIMLAVTRRFRFGTEVEEELKKMGPPGGGQQKQDDGEAQAQAAANQTAIATEKMKQQSLQMDMELKAQEHAQKMQELKMKGELSLLDYQLKKQQLQQQAALAAQTAKTSGEG